MTTRRSKPFAGVAVRLTAVGALACWLAACALDSNDADQPDSTVPGTVEGGCDVQLVEAIAAWGTSGFNGEIAIDTPEGQCRIGSGTLAPDDPRPIDGDTVFAIGSVSKAFTAAAVLQLAADGTLSLDDRVARYVDGLEGPIASATIESLLLHTSGLVGGHGSDQEPLTRDQAVEAISGLDVDPSAHGEFLYSNSGYTLLALVVEGATGIPFREYMTTHVTPTGAGFWDGEPEPEGTRATGVINGAPSPDIGQLDRDHWATQGNGDLAMSASTLADWAQRLFAGDVVPEPELERITKPSLDADGQGVTAGWVLLPAEQFGEPMLATAGGGGDVGHNVAVAWLPESDRTIVVASSTDGVSAEDLLLAIGSALVAGGDVPLPETPIEVVPASLERAVGDYELDADSRFEVSLDDTTLVVVPVGAAAFEALRLTNGRDDTDVAAHERAVAQLLTDETGPGADELALLEKDFGPLRGAQVLGSTIEDRELRTYVELTFDESDVIGWYALNDAGGIEGVDLAGPPRVGLVPTADGYRVAEQPPSDDAVVVNFEDRSMTIRSGARPSVVATRG